MVLRIVGTAFGIASAALFRAAFRDAREIIRLQRDGIRAAATVRELKESQSDETTVFAPVFEFSTADGKVHRIESDTAVSPPAHAVGDEVTVVYHPADPAGARIEYFTGMWLGAVLMSAGAVLCLVVAVLCLVLPQ